MRAQLYLTSALSVVIAKECKNDATFKDSYGDGCEWYETDPDNCGRYGEGSWAACCACGGGYSDSINAVEAARFVGGYVNTFYVGEAAKWPE